MGILFDSDGEYINHGSGATLDDLTTLTVLIGFYPTTIDTSYRSILSKLNDPGGGSIGWYVALSDRWDSSVPNSFQAWRSYSTTKQKAFAEDNQLTLNAWNFISVYFPAVGNVPILYHAVYPNILANVTEQDTAVGSGTLDSDASYDLYAGGDMVNQISRGSIGFYAVWNGQVSLTDLQMVQNRPLLANLVGDCRLLCFPALDGASNIVDYSGNGNDGTVNNATISTVRMPLSPIFGIGDGANEYQVSAPSNVPMFKVNSGLVNAGLINKGLVA